MGSNQNKVWILLLIGAIVTIVAVLTPATMGFPLYQWLWALRIWAEREPDFNDSELAVVGAILETAVLVVAIVLMFMLAIKLKKGSTVKGIYGIMLACLIMLVAAPVGYIIGAAVGYGEDYWLDNTALFGIYGPFIAAGLLIVSFLFLKKK